MAPISSHLLNGTGGVVGGGGRAGESAEAAGWAALFGMAFLQPLLEVEVGVDAEAKCEGNEGAGED